MNRIAVSAVLVAFGVAGVFAQQPKRAFEVVSVRAQPAPFQFPPGATASPRVRPGGRFSGTHATIASLIMFAYDLQDHQVSGGPDWVRQGYFDVNAQAQNPDASAEEIRLMVQSLLDERFTLVARREQREMEHLVLVLAREDGRVGPYLQRVDECSNPEARAEAQAKFPPRAETNAGGSSLGCGPLANLALLIGLQAKMPVVDKTGLDGIWVHSTRFASLVGSNRAAGTAAPSDPSLPSFEVALQEQLGLKLESGRGPIEVLVIESVQQPTEN